MTRWQVLKLFFTWDIAAKLAEYFPLPVVAETAPGPTMPAPQSRYHYDPVSSRMVRR